MLCEPLVAILLLDGLSLGISGDRSCEVWSDLCFVDQGALK